MSQKKKVQLNLNINEEHRNFLRTMAAERMLKDPNTVFTAAGIAADIVSQYINKLNEQKK